MKNPTRASSPDVAQIEQRLADALRATAPVAADTPVDTSGFSARELLQMAWDRAEEELDQLQSELRRLRQQHQAEERGLLSRINDKKRLQRELLDRAPRQEAG